MSDGLLYRLILLDGAVFLRHYRIGLFKNGCRNMVSQRSREVDTRFVDDVTSRVRDASNAEPAKLPAPPCRVISLEGRRRPKRPAPEPRLVRGVRENGQAFFGWQYPPGGEVVWIESRRPGK